MNENFRETDVDERVFFDDYDLDDVEYCDYCLEPLQYCTCDSEDNS